MEIYTRSAPGTGTFDEATISGGGREAVAGTAGAFSRTERSVFQGGRCGS